MDAVVYNALKDLPTGVKNELIELINSNPSVPINILITNYLNNATYGLNALKTAINNSNNYLSNTTYGLNALKTAINSVQTTANTINTASGKISLSPGKIKTLHVSESFNGIKPSGTVLKTITGKILEIYSGQYSIYGIGIFSKNDSSLLLSLSDNYTHIMSSSNKTLKYYSSYESKYDYYIGDYITDDIIVKTTNQIGSSSGTTSYNFDIVYV